MFWHRKEKHGNLNPVMQPKSESVSESKPVSVSTLEIVKQNSISAVDYNDEQLEHMYAHQEVVGNDRDDPVGYFYPNFVEKLFDHDFACFVKSDFVSKFKYCATLAGISRHPAVFEKPELPYSTGVAYVGDIPQPVIERLEVAQELLRTFTVHSREPLKVERLRMVDPVLIGWYDNPAIVVNEKGEFQRCSKYCLGVVISVWDYDKEFGI